MSGVQQHRPVGAASGAPHDALCVSVNTAVADVRFGGLFRPAVACRLRTWRKRTLLMNTSNANVANKGRMASTVIEEGARKRLPLDLVRASELPYPPKNVNPTDRVQVADVAVQRLLRSSFSFLPQDGATTISAEGADTRIGHARASVTGLFEFDATAARATVSSSLRVVFGAIDSTDSSGGNGAHHRTSLPLSPRRREGGNHGV